MLKYLSVELKNLRVPERIAANEDEKLYEFETPFVITSESEGRWLVTGSEIERLVAMTDFTTDENVAMFKRKLKKMGFIEALKTVEVLCDGDIFSIGEMEFEFWEFFN